jgi:cellulose biosynthesis protein BcsQ
LKNRYEYRLDDLQVEQIAQDLQQNTEHYDYVIIPQSTNPHLLYLAQKIANQVIILEKNSKEEIIRVLQTQQFMKSEKQKLFQTIESMDTVRINQIAGNQRHRFISCLFKPLSEDVYSDLGTSRIVLLDDAIFSGTTFLAMLHHAKKINSDVHKLALFSKQPASF